MNRRIYNVFNCLFRWLQKPFTEEIRFLVFAFCFSSIVDIIGHSVLYSIQKGIYIGLHHYLFCYILVLVSCIIPLKFRSIYKIIVYVLLVMNLIIDLVCVYSFHFTFNQELPAILLGTNKNEAYEFLELFMPFRLIIIMVLSLLFFYCFYRVLNKISLKNKRIRIVLLSLLFISILGYIRVDWNCFGEISLTKFYAFINATSPPDLSLYQGNLDLIYSKDKKPKNIVMIIGESFSKTHSSLYGYDKKTNPKLESLFERGELYLFNDVHSPALNTVPVFISLMSTYRPEYKDSIDWYRCITLQNILKKSGYYSFWFSNQSKAGFHDNIVAKYAMLCDKTVFTGNRFAGNTKKDLDEILIDSIKQYRYNKSYNYDYSFYFIHLMGSHYNFTERYPSHFDVFKDRHYPKNVDIHKRVLAAYDNSVLYNDSVVYEIINNYKNDESIIFYFSDHSLDIYDSRDDYVGHARYNDEKSVEAGSNIPFMVYMSPKYKMNFPDDCERIRKAVNKKFRTDDMIYTIMDVIGVDFYKRNEVYQNSLFR